MEMLKINIVAATVLFVYPAMTKGQQCPPPDIQQLLTTTVLGFRQDLENQLQEHRENITRVIEANNGDKTAPAVRMAAINMIDGFITLSQTVKGEADVLVLCLTIIGEQVYRPRIEDFSNFLQTTIGKLNTMKSRIQALLPSNRERRQTGDVTGAILDALLQSIKDYLTDMQSFLDKFLGPEANYACRVDPDEIFLTVYDGIGFDVRSVFVENYKGHTGCEAVEGDGSFATPFTLSINTSTCGVAGNGTTAAPYTVKVLATRSDVIISLSDFEFVLACNGSTSTQTSTNVTTDGARYIPGVPVIRTEEVFLYVFNSNDQKINGCQLGEDIKLGIELTKSPTAQGARPMNCIAYNPNRTAEIALLVDGCPLTTNPLDAILALGFARQATSAETAVSHSGLFKCFRFPSSFWYTIECEVEFCSKDDDTECINAPTCGQRRRRSVSVDRVQKVYDTIRVTLGRQSGHGVSFTGDNWTGVHDEKSSQTTMAPKIWESTEFIGVVCALGVASLIIAIMCFVTCYQRRMILKSKENSKFIS
ncbi:uncharacterized protein LOC106153348 [Lingula anatina]|uniref:Uncharacterized protein LOC106153348 n=1 Tax=Lingula anatina TaxID=7574 RepID=A0A1S3HB45_LINAN|nr:uncharacterized protein LOC106153348 [Lingula anatina]|eukprot:XP_013382696.1 uncharacterized protein LOC106153348 [Lingula anatina]